MSIDPQERATALLSRMTLEDKIHMVHGHVASRYSVPALEHLGIPALNMTDGPSGVNAGGDGEALSTAFPSSLALAATFDPGLAQAQGAAIASELLAHRMNVLLAPNLDVVRHPWWGRATEQYGEEPALIAAMGAGFVTGVQGQGVVANAKHFAAYTQETGRMQAHDIRTDETTLREVYLAAFEHVVKVAKVDSVMSSFNRINGSASAESPLIQDVLKDEWGFQGWIMSDYGSLSDAIPAALAGFDQEMPGVASEAAPAIVREGYPGMPGGDALFGGVLRRAVHDGLVPMARLDDMVLRILRTLIARGVLDHDSAQTKATDVDAHRAIARKVAAEGLTLLHNPSGVLPLQDLQSVLLIGADADRRTGTGGASVVARSTAAITPHDGISALCADLGIAFRFLPGADRVGPSSMLPGPEAVPSSVLLTPDGKPGLQASYWLSGGDHGEPAVQRIDPQVALDIGFLSQLMNASGQEPPPGAFGDQMTVRWSGQLIVPVAGHYRLSITCMGSGYLDIGGKRALNIDAAQEPTVSLTDPIWLDPDHPLDLLVGYSTSAHANWLELGDMVLGWEPPADTFSPAMVQAADAARRADVAIVFAHPYESEQRDRFSLSLPNGQDRLIAAVAAANPRTVVVLSSGGPVLMPWLDQVAAVLQVYHPGQEGGAALADALWGNIDPAGRLPLTYPRHEADVPVDPPQKSADTWTNIAEGSAVGHRAYHTKGVAPLFPFGHGLSYASFRYGALSITRGLQSEDVVIATVQVTNLSSRQGVTVVQVYQRAPRSRGGWHRLVGFAKVHVPVHGTAVAQVRLSRRDLSFWDTETGQFVLPAEGVEIGFGTSATDILEWAQVAAGAND
jgi:beta-glucosidase